MFDGDVRKVLEAHTEEFVVENPMVVVQQFGPQVLVRPVREVMILVFKLSILPSSSETHTVDHS